MRKLKLIFCFVVFATIANVNTSSDEKTVQDLKKFMVKSKKYAYKTLKLLLEHNELVIFKGFEFIKYIQNLRPESDFDPTNVEDQFARINLKLDKISKDLANMKRELLTAQENSNDMKYLEDELTIFYNSVHTINKRYDTFTNELSNPDKTYLKFDYDNFNTNVLEHGGDGVDDILDNIHRVLLNTEVKSQNVFSYLAELRLKKITMCLRKQSLQQFIYDVLEIALAAQTKGLVLINAAVEYQKLKENASGADNIKTAETNFKSRTTDLYNEAIRIGVDASRDVWRCDPRNPAKGKTYATIGPLFQKYILHENDGISNYCFEECKDGKHLTSEHHLKCRTDFCRETARTRYFCRGQIRDCEYKGWTMKFCRSEDNDRRYNYITIDGEVNGRYGSCTNERNATSVSDIFYKCNYCICTCDESLAENYGEFPNINKYFSLIPVETDWWDNKIVTGVKLQLENNIFSIQIEQGVLRSDSKWKIEVGTTSWKNTSHKHNKETDVPKSLLKFDWDFRGICLDAIRLPKNHVVTGLKFAKGQSRIGNHECIKLVVKASEIIYPPEKGTHVWTLFGASKWLNEEESVTQRNELKFEVPDVPLEYSDHELDYRKNLYVQFDTSDFKKDAGQSVIPYIDIQPVYSPSPAPLSGVSLIHKGRPESAGYVGFKLTTYDVTETMELPQT